uniref:Uncharacterized protein n=1 Tax=Anopheles atroparvus TaxID=41427 RepID=A0AAG5DGS8_ANOAO
MKLTIVLAISLATLASLCTASPLLVTKHVVKKLVDRHFSPPETETVVVYTPVEPYHQVLPHTVPHHQLLPLVEPFSHGKFLPDLGAFMKHPLLQQHPLLKLLPKHTTGGVVQVHHQASAVPSAPYPPAVHELPHEPEPAVPVPDCVDTPAPVAPVPEHVVPVAPVPEYGPPAPVVPAAVYGPPASTGNEFSSSSSVSSASTSNAAGPVTEAKYVAVNPGARHEASLPGHTQSVLIENLGLAAGTEGLQQLPPVVQTDLRQGWNPVALDGNQLPSDYLRSAGNPDVWTVVEDGTEPEARYIAINGELRHEAPLPGYDHSIVIENLDKV